MPYLSELPGWALPAEARFGEITRPGASHRMSRRRQSPPLFPAECWSAFPVFSPYYCSLVLAMNQARRQAPGKLRRNVTPLEGVAQAKRNFLMRTCSYASKERSFGVGLPAGPWRHVLREITKLRLFEA